jgi:hypothetical protein
VAIDPRIASAFEEQNGFPLEPHLVVLGLMGSHSHGTYLPPEEPNAVDDVDLMGFVVPPIEFHLGLPRWQHWTLQVDELDVVLYSLEKAVRLLLKSNPNIVGLLWLRDSDYVHRHQAFEELRREREIFSSQAAAEAFAGYAADQLKRMEAFDLDRMAEYEALTKATADAAPPPVSRLGHSHLTWQLASGAPGDQSPPRTAWSNRAGSRGERPRRMHARGVLRRSTGERDDGRAACQRGRAR